MAITNRNIIHWLPRILGLLYAVFLSLFAFDVWGTGSQWWQELAAFLVHLLPVYFIVAVLVVAWRNTRLGGILFIVLATAFGAIFARGEVSTLLLVAMIPTAIGLMFIGDGCVNRTELQPRI